MILKNPPPNSKRKTPVATELQSRCVKFCKIVAQVSANLQAWCSEEDESLERLKVGCLCRLAVLFVQNKQRLARMQRKKGIKKERKNERKNELKLS